jgi:glycosyltransferase involved in cell wall biosynthesis
MKVSIITCTWNSEPYLQESIESVLAQDYPDIEYIFVDGGSTDGTLERIRALTRPYTLLNDVRGGVSRAMNEGIRAATGDIVAHLHGDDYYLHPNTISTVVKAFQERKAAWLIGQAVRNVNGQMQHPMNARTAYSYGRLLGGGFNVPHVATFVRRRLFEELGMFDETLKYSMDWDLWLRLAHKYPPTVIEEELAVRRQHEGSLSAASPQSKLKARREERQVRMRYALRAPIRALIFLARYWVRTRRLRREAAMLTEQHS